MARAALALVATAGFVLLGCKETRLPNAQFASARAAVERAVTAGAAEIPAATPHLFAAESQLSISRKLFEDGEYERAGWVSYRAQAEGDLAHAIARAARVERDARMIEEEAR